MGLGYGAGPRSIPAVLQHLLELIMSIRVLIMSIRVLIMSIRVLIMSKRVRRRAALYTGGPAAPS